MVEENTSLLYSSMALTTGNWSIIWYRLKSSTMLKIRCSRFVATAPPFMVEPFTDGLFYVILRLDNMNHIDRLKDLGPDFAALARGAMEEEATQYANRFADREIGDEDLQRIVDGKLDARVVATLLELPDVLLDDAKAGAKIVLQRRKTSGGVKQVIGQ